MAAARPTTPGRRASSRADWQGTLYRSDATVDELAASLDARLRSLSRGPRRWSAAASAVEALIYTRGRTAVREIVRLLSAPSRGVVRTIMYAHASVTRAPSARVVSVDRTARDDWRRSETSYAEPAGSAYAAPDRVTSEHAKARAMVTDYARRLDGQPFCLEASPLGAGALWVAVQRVGAGFLRYLAARVDRAPREYGWGVATALRTVAGVVATESPDRTPARCTGIRRAHGVVGTAGKLAPASLSAIGYRPARSAILRNLARAAAASAARMARIATPGACEGVYGSLSLAVTAGDPSSTEHASHLATSTLDASASTGASAPVSRKVRARKRATVQITRQ